MSLLMNPLENRTKLISSKPLKSLPSGFVPKHLRHNAFYRWVYRKVHFYGEDCIIGVSGPTGYGKTTLSVKLAEILDVDYTGKSRFTAREFFEYKKPDGTVEIKETLVPRLINSITSYKNLRTKTDYPKGTAFIIDEAQVLINSRDFMSNKNKDVLKLISTGRIFGGITFINLPYWYNLDSQVKNYLHAVIMVDRPDKAREMSRWTPYLIKPQGYNKPPWVVRFRRRDRETRRIFVLEKCESSLPSKELNEAQQIKTTQWKNLLHQGKITSQGDLVTGEVGDKRGRKVSVDNAELSEYWLDRIKDKPMDGFRYKPSLLFFKVEAQRKPDDPYWSKEISRLVVEKLKIYDLKKQDNVKDNVVEKKVSA